MKKLSLALASTALAAAALSCAPACASVTVDIDQVGSNVIVSSTGSINLAGTRSSDLVYALDAAIGPSFSDVGTGTQFTPVDGYFGLTGPSQFGTGSGTYADFGAGDPFAFSQRDGAVFVAQGYVSGGAIHSSATFNGRTFDALGLTPGTYVFASRTIPSR